MSDEMNEVPSVDEIKDRLKVEIPVEEEEVLKVEVDKDQPEVIEELRSMGRKFAETLQTAWNSEERAKIESEIREGVKSFVDEVDKVVRDVRGGNVAKPNTNVSASAETEAEAAPAQDRTNIDIDDIGRKTRDGMVKGLRWLSVEMGKLADQFTARPEESATSTGSGQAEKSPEDIG